MRAFLIFMFMMAGLWSPAQDLTGIWRGHFERENERTADIPGMDDRYKFEVQVDQKDKLIKGVTYSYKTTIFYGKASCYGAINKQTKKVFLEETKILDVKTASGGACIMTCFLQYSKVGDEEILEGHYSSIDTKDSTQCGKGTVYLRKVETSDFYKEPFLEQKEKPRQAPTKIKPITPSAPGVKPPPPAAVKNNPPTKATPPVKPKPVKPARPQPRAPTVAVPKKTDNPGTIPDDSLKKIIGKNPSSIVVPRVLATRQNELVRTIITSAKDITIKIYDNGAIDNDTVSVFIDKKLVVSKARLTEKAIVVTMNLDGTMDEHELVMVAENLGDIPPNTSLMVVSAGDQEYEVRITSTEQKNAVVLFKYDPKK
jgi:hypothetical protein